MKFWIFAHRGQTTPKATNKESFARPCQTSDRNCPFWPETSRSKMSWNSEGARKSCKTAPITTTSRKSHKWNLKVPFTSTKWVYRLDYHVQMGGLIIFLRKHTQSTSFFMANLISHVINWTCCNKLSPSDVRNYIKYSNYGDANEMLLLTCYKPSTKKVQIRMK